MEQWRRTLKAIFQTKETITELTISKPSGSDPEPLSSEPSELSGTDVHLYIDTLLSGEEPAEKIPQIHQSVIQNPQELEELQDILKTFQEEASEPLPSFQSKPRYTLDFLATSSTSPSNLPSQIPSPSIPQKIQELFQQGNVWIHEQNQCWINAATLLIEPNQLASAIVATRGTKGRAEDEKPIIKSFSRVEGDLDLEVKALANDDEESCTLVIRAILQSQWPKKEGVQIVILHGDSVTHPSTAQQLTDKEGVVVFENFPQRHLESLTINFTSIDE